MRSQEKLYRFHVENLRAIEVGLSRVLGSARLAIANDERRLLSTYVRLYAFLMGAWAECRLLKLLYEPSAFSSEDREDILGRKALDRWLRVVEISFRRHYRIPHAELKPPALPSTASSRMRELNAVLSEDLGAVITLRNKLAHGQWRYPLNDALTDIAQHQMCALRKENILSLKQKTALIDSLCNSIHDLAVSKSTFDRDFDKHFRQLEQIRTNLVRKSYARWADQTRLRHQRGREKMIHHLKGG